MKIRWYGQSAFLLQGKTHSVFTDPFYDTSHMAARGIRFAYPKIRGVHADLLLITHEHGDHNGQEAIESPGTVIRSTAGTFDTPYGKVVGVNSDHDEAGGSQRGANKIYTFEIDGLRVCHMGDIGQAALRPEQRAAIGKVDVLMLPVGAGPTIGPAKAREIATLLSPRWIIPMHYRTELLDMLELPDPFFDMYERKHRVGGTEIDLDKAPDTDLLIFDIPSV